MIGHTLKWVPDPVPKPIAVRVWMPIAEKLGLSICFKNKCVSSCATGDAPFVVEFWDDVFEEKDVGACVVKVPKILKGEVRNG